MDFLVINEHKQKINYYLLPKKSNDDLLINIPLIILEPIADWINKKFKSDVYLLLGISKYTLKDAYVNEHKIFINRYSLESREIKVKFNIMISGYIKSISK
jgi:hypothetical protein